MNYSESKKKIDKIRYYDEIMFRMAILHLMDVGTRHFDEEIIKRTCEEINKRDDSKSVMTNSFMCNLVRMAGELAKIDHIHLLVYIQREIDYDVLDNTISHKRAIHLLKNCIEWIEETNLDVQDTLKFSLGFDNEEIEILGFGYLLDFGEEKRG